MTTTKESLDLTLAIIDNKLGSAVADICKLLSLKGASELDLILRDAKILHTIEWSRFNTQNFSKSEFERQQIIDALVVGLRHGIIVRKSKLKSNLVSTSWSTSLLPEKLQKRKEKQDQLLREATHHVLTHNNNDSSSNDTILYEFSHSTAQRFYFGALCSKTIQFNFGPTAQIIWEVVQYLGDAPIKEIIDTCVSTCEKKSSISHSSKWSVTRQEIQEQFERLVNACVIVPREPNLFFSITSNGTTSSLSSSSSLNQNNHNDDDDEEEDEEQELEGGITTTKQNQQPSSKRSKIIMESSSEDDGDDDDDGHNNNYNSKSSSSSPTTFLLPRLSTFDYRNTSYTRPHPILFEKMHDLDKMLTESQVKAQTSKETIDFYNNLTPSTRLGFSPQLMMEYTRTHISTKNAFEGNQQGQGRYSKQDIKNVLEMEDVLWTIGHGYMIRMHMCHLIARHYADLLGDCIAYEVVMIIFEKGLEPVTHNLFPPVPSSSSSSQKRFKKNNDPYTDYIANKAKTIPQSTSVVHVEDVITSLLERHYWDQNDETVETNKETRREIIFNVIQSLIQVCGNQGFIGSNGHPPRSIRIDLNMALAQIRFSNCAMMIERLYGKSARQEFTMLVHTGGYEEINLARGIVSQPKETRAGLHALYAAGMVTIQEVPRGSSFTPGTMYQLWRVNVPFVMAECAKIMQITLQKAYLRFIQERENVHVLTLQHERNEIDLQTGDVDEEYVKTTTTTTTTTSDLAAAAAEDESEILIKNNEEEDDDVQEVTQNTTSSKTLTRMKHPGESKHNPIDLVDLEDTLGRTPLENATIRQTSTLDILQSAVHVYFTMCDLSEWSENKFASWERALSAEFGYMDGGA
jgi:hypothetical protein